LTILHLLFELRAEGIEIQLEKSNITAHHAEMGNLLSLYPKIHCLDADTQVHSGLADRQRKFVGQKRECSGASNGAMVLGEVLWTHAYL
jgi:hypothetical protein